MYKPKSREKKSPPKDTHIQIRGGFVNCYTANEDIKYSTGTIHVLLISEDVILHSMSQFLS